METLTQTPPPSEQASPMFCISWERIQGGPGRGTGTRKFTRAEADQICAELNEEYKHIRHTVIPA